MFRPKSYIELCFAMQSGAEVVINDSTGTIHSIAKECGSGRGFNVTMIRFFPADSIDRLRHPQELTVTEFFRDE